MAEARYDVMRAEKLDGLLAGAAVTRWAALVLVTPAASLSLLLLVSVELALGGLGLHLYSRHGRAVGFLGWSPVVLASIGALLLAMALADLALSVGVGGGAAARGIALSWVAVLLLGLAIVHARLVQGPVAATFVFGWLLVYGHVALGGPRLLLVPFGIALGLVTAALICRGSAASDR